MAPQPVPCGLGFVACRIPGTDGLTLPIGFGASSGLGRLDQPEQEPTGGEMEGAEGVHQAASLGVDVGAGPKTSGRRCSLGTWPPVAASIFGAISAGT